MNNNKYLLTKTEIGILKYIASGYSNKEIAKKNNVRLVTVRSQINKIFSKLGISYEKNNKTSMRVMATLLFFREFTQSALSWEITGN